MIENIDSDQAIMAASIPGVKGTGITLTLPKGSMEGQDTDLVYNLPKTNKITVSIIEQWCSFVRQQSERKADKAVEAAARRRTEEALASREATDTPIFTGNARAGDNNRKESKEAVQDTRESDIRPTDDRFDSYLRAKLDKVSRRLSISETAIVKLTQEKAAIEAALGVYDNDGVQPVPGISGGSAAKEDTGKQRPANRKARTRKPAVKKED